MSQRSMQGSVSLGERLLQMESVLSRIEHKLDTKAENTTVVAMEKRVAILEVLQAESAAVDRYKRWLYGMSAAVVLSLSLHFLKWFGLILR